MVCALGPWPMICIHFHHRKPQVPLEVLFQGGRMGRRSLVRHLVSSTHSARGILWPPEYFAGLIFFGSSHVDLRPNVWSSSTGPPESASIPIRGPRRTQNYHLQEWVWVGHSLTEGVMSPATLSGKWHMALFSVCSESAKFRALLRS